MQVQSLGWEDPLEMGMAIHSSMFSPTGNLGKNLFITCFNV